MTIQRRTLIGAAAAGTLAVPRLAPAQDAPGVTATEIRIGSTNALSGPVSAYSVISRCLEAMFRRLNDQGGVGGRKVSFTVYDDAYQPPRTLEQTRRLVEQDRVAFLFNSLGTPTNNAIHRYVNQRKVPHLFLATGADKWAQPKEFPWTIGWQPSYRTEAQIYAKHILAERPQGRIALLYQNDDFGKDYLNGLKDVLGNRPLTTATYEATDPTIDSQIVQLQGHDVLVCATTPRFAAQAIRRVFDIGWRPMMFMTNVSVSVGAVMQPAGVEKGVGLITSDYRKDQTDPAWATDAGMNEWRDFMRRYIPDADLTDNNYTYAYGAGSTMIQVLRQCGTDFSRENVMRQATNIAPMDIATLLPGIRVQTQPDNYHVIRQMQLQRWDGRSWVRFGNVIEGANV
ncbi:ABC transporter substrate-binding protein [Paracraurococcus ruber]|uniref:Branched-chain amino acid ABC transporter substrate-binding protein n=1 Tax=Paracraurococcus ruber TaxID=77675 RepID=A0ABS1CZK0_9PROT|nr:ABC transporter substrate-binding protein [Paracraurococcus ruber]MBK1659963.1 branched-chain amino acid ABC transporter substrate-binding protein [Paracraurococcus ruber]TDG28750.1 branched-chain amino acid ABC transporter substrate-binding protein [Paracraurococcus ruber]